MMHAIDAMVFVESCWRSDVGLLSIGPDDAHGGDGVMFAESEGDPVIICAEVAVCGSDIASIFNAIDGDVDGRMECGLEVISSDIKPDPVVVVRRVVDEQ